MKKRIIVACGTGIATSTVIALKVEEILNENDIDGEIIQCRVSEIKSYKDIADIIITSTNLSDSYDLPVLHAISFISGIGIEETTQKIVNILKNE